ncbi:twin-arginine translocase subunit TatC [Desulfurivibrio dismutans]|uniref:twin-arginine translocase subunit TatC n=1 Tax=Desulfurivibrio dismutans TaxID=1398908 RepID=UPI0023DA240F|nr:twin-arginine translocase subunit TatC [Desulfurivibrio alkaliphilus]MDF1614922.1 twin-arginine translocase subunit TatC [Desulfurivibrio alkaliphilus]
MARRQGHPLARIIRSLRGPSLYLGLTLVAATAAFTVVSPRALIFLQNHLSQELAYFTVTDPFLAHVRLGLALALFSLVPFFVYWFWKAMAEPFGLTRTTRAWFVIFCCLLFYGGTMFCFFVTLPLGVNFLLGYQSEQLQAVIAVGKFVTFITVFVLAFGFIAMLPIFMIFGAKTGLCPRRKFESGRGYAVLIMTIVAALITPTPDVVNLSFMAVPMYLLYESGIIIIRMMKLE